ncbi:mitochondrial carrier [Meredithblackwellia eburnea MCA 4105]
MASTLPPIVQATSGALGGVVSNALVYPLDVVTTRMQTTAKSSAKKSKKNNLPNTFTTMLKNEGPATFYRGLASDSISTALSNFIYFAVYSFLRNTLINRRIKHSPPPPPPSSKNAKDRTAVVVAPVLSALEELVIGIIAGIWAKGTVSPLSNITVRQQTAATLAVKENNNLEEGKQLVVQDSDSDDDDDHFATTPSMREVAQDILDEKGWTGFWSGFKSSILLTTNPALTSFLVDFFRRSLIPQKHLQHPTPAQVFFTGAVASSCASFLTYPLILSKSRLMYKSPSGRRLYKSNVDVFRKTIKKYGVWGMYAGLQGQLTKGFLSEGIKGIVKDRMEQLIVLLHRILTRQGTL